MILEFARWLDGTEFSVWLRFARFGIQSLQTIHILALAALLGAAMLLDLRLLGVVKSGDTAAHLARRFLPLHWIGLAVLLPSGLLLIAAEPGQLIFNTVLRAKLALVVAAALLTLWTGRALRADMRLADLPRGRRSLLAALGGASLLLWLAIGTMGRFIAYIG